MQRAAMEVALAVVVVRGATPRDGGLVSVVGALWCVDVDRRALERRRSLLGEARVVVGTGRGNVVMVDDRDLRTGRVARRIHIVDQRLLLPARVHTCLYHQTRLFLGCRCPARRCRSWLAPATALLPLVPM